MDHADLSARRFACTQCGRCCNRPPEVELGEAAALADVFAWQVLFRLYSLPRNPQPQLPSQSREQAAAEFYETRRLLTRFAAHTFEGKALVAGVRQPRSFYLTISALAFDPGLGNCPMLSNARCSIYPRRPLSCRSVPLHYSRPLAAAPRDLDAFVATPGFACATGPDAAVILRQGQIVDAELAAAHLAAADRADADRPWKKAIVKAMKAGSADLPSLAQIEQHAATGALTVPMRSAWKVAVKAGLYPANQAQDALAAQASLLEHMARQPGLPLQKLQEIAELRRAAIQPL